MRRVLLVGAMVLATLLGFPATPAGTAAAAGVAEPVDFNGDNLDDLAMGAPGEDLGVHAGAGAVNVQYGSPAGLAGNRQVLTQGTPEAGDHFGAALAKGRFNDDDFIDLAVGAPDEDLGRTDGAGVVTVFYGSASGLTGPGDILRQFTPENGDAFGATLDSGDFNADAVDDLTVGVALDDLGDRPDAGLVSLLQGSPAGLQGVDTVYFQGADLGGGAGVGGVAEAGDLLGAAVE